MNVVYEQPAEFNRFVDDSIPLTWHRRWRSLKPAMPGLVFFYVIIAEMFALRRWLADGESPSLNDLPFALLVPFLIIPLLFLLVEGAMRIEQRSKRALKLKDNWLCMTPSRVSQVRWKNIRAWRFEPIEDRRELTRLSVLLGPAKQGGWRRRWSMVLASRAEREELLATLESRRDARDCNYEVRVLQQAQPPPKAERARGSFAAGISVYLLGTFLLVHGGPPLALGVFGFKDLHRADPSLEQPRAQSRRHFMIWLTAHFSSSAELRRFLLLTGGVLTACSAASLVGGSRLMNRTIKRTWMAHEADFLSPK